MFLVGLSFDLRFLILVTKNVVENILTPLFITISPCSGLGRCSGFLSPAAVGKAVAFYVHNSLRKISHAYFLSTPVATIDLQFARTSELS